MLSQGNISSLTLCLVRIELRRRRFRKPTFIGLKSGLTSISRVFHKPLFVGLNCRCGLHLRLKELLHYCCLSLAASMGTTIEQYRSGIGCHNNFVKAKDNFSWVQGRFWNMIKPSRGYIGRCFFFVKEMKVRQLRYPFLKKNVSKILKRARVIENKRFF